MRTRLGTTDSGWTATRETLQTPSRRTTDIQYEKIIIIPTWGTIEELCLFKVFYDRPRQRLRPSLLPLRSRVRRRVVVLQLLRGQPQRRVPPRSHGQRLLQGNSVGAVEGGLFAEVLGKIPNLPKPISSATVRPLRSARMMVRPRREKTPPRRRSADEGAEGG